MYRFAIKVVHDVERTEPKAVSQGAAGDVSPPTRCRDVVEYRAARAVTWVSAFLQRDEGSGAWSCLLGKFVCGSAAPQQVVVLPEVTIGAILHQP